MSSRWKQLLALATEEVGETLETLPAGLRQEASQVHVRYESVPGPELTEDGIEPDTLGLFVGNTYADGGVSAGPYPTRIFLFLENLWEFADGDEAIYREEIRRTMLHELGHYLGLDEEDLTDRGLE
jgi:predicted Zn-dependent protease with MMP-like domain